MIRRWAASWWGLTKRLQELERRDSRTGENLALVAAALARWEHRGDEPDPSFPLTTRLCSRAGCEGPTYRRWCQALKEPRDYHRKQWEWAYICQALEERGMLVEGKRGLGFGVGTEPLASLFAARGCQIVATDLARDAAVSSGWTATGSEHMADAPLNQRRLCAPELFAERVSTRSVNMRDIPSDLRGFDFCWSSCALEHLGTIEAGLAFVEQSLECVRPGGLAVHTTEYNLSSNEDTVRTGATVLLRRRDVEALARRLDRRGHRLAPLELDGGSSLLDGFVDVPPFHSHFHLRLQIGSYTCTSLGLIAERAAA